jgi:hypothetical protein
LAQLIADLDDNRFAVRQRASAELAKLGELAGPALEQVLKDRPSLEVQNRVERLLEKLSNQTLSPEALRALRAVEVLEKAGTPHARKLLEAIAGGAPGAQLTEDALLAVRRLGK